MCGVEFSAHCPAVTVLFLFCPFLCNIDYGSLYPANLFLFDYCWVF